MNIHAIKRASGHQPCHRNRHWWQMPNIQLPLFFSLLICMFVFLFASQGVAGDDAYMKQLEAELSSGGGDVDKANKKGGVESRSLVREIESESLDRPGFESSLQTGHPSTFSLYGKLEEHKKIQVYNEYRVTGSYKAVSKKVLKLLYGI